MLGLPLQIMPFGSSAVAGLYQVRNTWLGHIAGPLALDGLKLPSETDLCQIVALSLAGSAAEVGDPVEDEVKEEVDLYFLDEVVGSFGPSDAKLHDLLILHLLNKPSHTVMTGGLLSAIEYKLV